MCSEDTRFQSLFHSAGIQVVGKLNKQCNGCNGHPRMINMKIVQWCSIIVLQENNFNFLQTGKRAKTLQLVKQGKNHDEYFLCHSFFFLSTQLPVLWYNFLTVRLGLKWDFYTTF